MDTVDNSSAERDRPHSPAADDARRAPVEASSGESADAPGTGDGALRGADLAREALRAARAAAAERRAQQQATQPGTGRRASGSGTRRRWSGPGPDDRDPQPFARLLGRLVADRGWSERLTRAGVLARWPELVGPEIADHCRPVSLRDGELVLEAESTAWATQLRTLQRRLLARLAESVGPDVVRRIRVTGPLSPTWRHGERYVPGRGPRDTYG